MQNLDGHRVESETETVTSIQTPEVDDWESFRDDDIMQQQSAIQAEEGGKIPFVGDKARKPLILKWYSFYYICIYIVYDNLKVATAWEFLVDYW